MANRLVPSSNSDQHYMHPEETLNLTQAQCTSTKGGNSELDQHHHQHKEAGQRDRPHSSSTHAMSGASHSVDGDAEGAAAAHVAAVCNRRRAALAGRRWSSSCWTACTSNRRWLCRLAPGGRTPCRPTFRSRRCSAEHRPLPPPA